MEVTITDGSKFSCEAHSGWKVWKWPIDTAMEFEAEWSQDKTKLFQII